MEAPSRRVLVNAPLDEEALRALEAGGFETLLVAERDFEAARRAVADCAALVVNAALPVDEELLARAPRLRVVARMGVGYDNVDVEAARRRGVRVVHTPLPVVEPVAEHTFALILALARRVAAGDRAMREGGFREPELLPGAELAGKVLGIVGLGRTGTRVAEIARRGFRMEVIYSDPAARPEVEAELGVRRLGLEELLAASDWVSLHLSLSRSTWGLIGRRELARMKPGAFLINVSRGAVVDEPALVAALESGSIAGAGLDVFAEEPLPRDHVLRSLPNVVLTPHVGGFSVESRRGMSRVVEDVMRVLRGEEPLFPVPC